MMSLHRRVALSAALVLGAFVVLTSVALEQAFRESAESARGERLLAQVYLLLGAAEEDPAGQLTLPEPLPEPRLGLGRKLRGRATACIDLSDGLALDLHRLCRASGTSARLDGVLPCAPGATLEQALFGGEDYELLCTLPAGAKPPRGLERIGVMTKGRGPGEIRFAGYRLEPRGWDPFR